MGRTCGARHFLRSDHHQGVGWPTLVASHIFASCEVLLRSENAYLGMGPALSKAQEDHHLIYAGKQPVTFCHAAFFLTTP